MNMGFYLWAVCYKWTSELYSKYFVETKQSKNVIVSDANACARTCACLRVHLYLLSVTITMDGSIESGQIFSLKSSFLKTKIKMFQAATT